MNKRLHRVIAPWTIRNLAATLAGERFDAG